MNQIQTHQSRVYRRSILKILKVISIMRWITFKVIRWGQIQLLQPKNDQETWWKWCETSVFTAWKHQEIAPKHSFTLCWLLCNWARLPVMEPVSGTPISSRFLLDDVINDESVILPSINFITLNMFITLVNFLSVFFLILWKYKESWSDDPIIPNLADVTVTPGALKAPQSPPGWVKQVSPPDEAHQGPLFGSRSPSAPLWMSWTHLSSFVLLLSFRSLVRFFLHRPTTPARLNQVWKENATVWTMEESRWVTLAIDGSAFCDLSVMMSWWNWTLSLSSFCSPRGQRVTRSVPEEAAPMFALYIVMLENGWKPKAGMIWRKTADPWCSLLCDERRNRPF